MGQPLLQVGVNSPTASVEKQTFSDRAASQKDKEIKPFSSTLNKHLDRPSQAQDNKKKSAESANDKHVNGKPETEVDDKVKVKAEEKDKESGNNLPSETSTDNPVFIIDKNVDIVEEFDTEGTGTATVDLAAIAQTITETTSDAKSQTTTVVKGKESHAYSSGHSNREQIVAASKATQSDAMKVDALSDKTAEAKPVLRSDILHAIIKKQDADNKNKPSAVISKESPVMAEKQPDSLVSERQKMAQILSEAKNDGLLLKPAQERTSSAFSASAMLSPTASTSSTLAPKTSSVGQSVLTMQPSVQSEAWGKVLSSRVVWMAREGVQQAQLRLNPANLGPVEVKLHMNNDQVNVSFVAQHAATRDALEQALPRLRESLQENGMNLADADVSDQTSEQQSEEAESGEAASNKQGLAHQTDELELEGAASDSDELELGVSVFA
jgi:flagellar hook-length control protein FliK